MDKLAIIGPGYMARIIAERAKINNIETHCFSNDEHSVAAEITDYYHNINILNLEQLAEKCKQVGVNGVVATTELTIYPAAYVAYKLGLNGNDLDVSKNITDKTYVREKVKDVEDLYQPLYWIYKNDTIPDINCYPVVVKPIAAGGKRGVTVVYSPDNLIKALEEAVKVSKVKGALIEEYLDGGKEYSVESLSYHEEHYIVQITEKISSGPPHCVELGHHQPADLSDLVKCKIKDVIANALACSGITNGPCHTEIKIINGRIYLIEINGRPGGDHIAYPLTELSTGFPYITGIINVSLDKFDKSTLKDIKHNYCGVLFVTSQTADLKPIFDECEKEKWFYKKNYVSDELKPILHNDGFNTNYFMYYSTTGRPQFNNIIEKKGKK